MVQDDGPVGHDRVQVAFDDEHVVAGAGVLLLTALADRLGIPAAVRDCVDLGEQAGAANADAKVMTLLTAMALGADSIDDCDRLRAGRTGRLLEQRVLAPSTLGTFLRAFSFGHVRQLDRVLAETLQAAWQTGAGPGDGRLVVDLDSFIREVHGHKKQGAAFGYTKVRGYHPLVATRADTGEVLHIRLRKGSAGSARGAVRFVDELIARVARANATGPKLLRADSAFFNYTIMDRLHVRGWDYSITVRLNKAIKTAIATIPDEDWITLADYPAGGEAQIAETKYGTRRLVVRRTRLVGDQAELWPDWRHHALLTNRTDTLAVVEAEHRQHAVVELAIRDLKDQALAHLPSGHYGANAAWTVLAALAHNLARWTQTIGLPDSTIRTSRSIRDQLLALPGRLVCHARQWTLRLPARWPWQTDFTTCLTNLRALPTRT